MKALAKKRNRKARQDDPFALAPVPRRYPSGKKAYSMDERRAARARTDEQDADRVALEARCRQAGWTEPKGGWVAEELAKARLQSMEGQAGLAITIGAKDDKERQRLWNVWRGLDGAEATYYRRILGKSRHAKTAKIEMQPPEAFEARPDDKPDLRDDDQKDRDAVNGWMRWRGYLGHLKTHERVSISQALQHKAGLVKDGKLSVSGVTFLAAMRVLADVVERK
tara:strand:- start:2495 stop:3166 length:672 start_codon:yes stop_codon:yes gene_type:complete